MCSSSGLHIFIMGFRGYGVTGFRGYGVTGFRGYGVQRSRGEQCSPAKASKAFLKHVARCPRQNASLSIAYRILFHYAIIIEAIKF